MWDDASSMRTLANGLLGIALLLFSYGAAYYALHLPLFPMRDLHISGEVQHVTREQVQSIAERELAGNFFTLDLARARAAFEKLPWVRQVSLRRRWPDGLEVGIEEHVALARWGSTALVNTYGEVFRAASDARLPVINAPDGAAREVVSHYTTFSQTLAQIGRSVTQLDLSPRRAWWLKLDDGLALKIGRDNAEVRLARFAASYPRSIARLKQQATYVDLRYANGFAARVAGLRWEGRHSI